MPSIRFSYADVRPITLEGKKGVKEFLLTMFEIEKKPLSRLNYIFCSDAFLLDINKSFLGHDYFTDIITFDLSEGEETIGEIYISVDRVKDNCLIHQSSYREEMLRVMFHGVLHLIGFKDKKKSEITVMRYKEEYYLRLFQGK